MMDSTGVGYYPKVMLTGYPHYPQNI